ncbi:MAG: hypothetical protein FD123_4175 [Bacteroidetes bacterium]|nr:MAG: hypothetical protein FD123_4175 [Bacteroidota bacterium]
MTRWTQNYLITIAFLSITIALLTDCSSSKRISLQEINPDRTITWYSDQDSFYIQFDRRVYQKFIEKDTSLGAVKTKINVLLESSAKDLNLDTIFKTVDNYFRHDNWNKDILYDDFIMSQLDKGSAIVMDMKNNKQVHFINRKSICSKNKRKMRIDYLSGKSLIFSHQYFVVNI